MNRKQIEEEFLKTQWKEVSAYKLIDKETSLDFAEHMAAMARKEALQEAYEIAQSYRKSFIRLRALAIASDIRDLLN